MARQGRENQYRDRRGADDQTGIYGLVKSGLRSAASSVVRP
jgi:hypothetical protein